MRPIGDSEREWLCQVHGSTQQSENIASRFNLSAARRCPVIDIASAETKEGAVGAAMRYNIRSTYVCKSINRLEGTVSFLLYRH